MGRRTFRAYHRHVEEAPRRVPLVLWIAAFVVAGIIIGATLSHFH
jgi:hypothetical protein